MTSPDLFFNPIGRDFQLKFQNRRVPPELINCRRIFGSISFSCFRFDVENTVTIVSLFSRFGFGIHELKIQFGTIPVNLFYLILSSIQESVEVMEIFRITLENFSNLEVFTGVSEFKRLKKLALRTDYDKFFTKIFQNTPALENLKVSSNFDIIIGKTKLKKLTVGGLLSNQKDHFPAITQVQSQLNKFKLQDLNLNNQSMENLKRFVESQKNINTVTIYIFEMEDRLMLIPLFTLLLNLDSLVFFKIAMDDAIAYLPADKINNRHVQALYIDNMDETNFAHCFRLFPSFTRFEANLAILVHSSDAVSSVNQLENLRELRISARYFDDDGNWNENYLKQLRIKNLEKISFREYPVRYVDRIEDFRAFIVNHPNLKEFHMETSDFPFAIVEVIVKNLRHLEKLVILTDNTSFAWNRDDVSRMRGDKGSKLSRFC